MQKSKMELLRVRFDEQVRGEKHKTASLAIESQATGNLKPWREVITPHKDVASGRYQQAEFAADLWQVVRVSRTPLPPEKSLLGGNVQGNAAFPSRIQLGLTAQSADSP